MEGELWQLEAQWFCIEKFFCQESLAPLTMIYSPLIPGSPRYGLRRQSQVNKNAMIQRQAVALYSRQQQKFPFAHVEYPVLSFASYQTFRNIFSIYFVEQACAGTPVAIIAEHASIQDSGGPHVQRKRGKFLFCFKILWGNSASILVPGPYSQLYLISIPVRLWRIPEQDGWGLLSGDQGLDVDEAIARYISNTKKMKTKFIPYPKEQSRVDRANRK